MVADDEHAGFEVWIVDCIDGKERVECVDVQASLGADETMIYAIEDQMPWPSYPSAVYISVRRPFPQLC